MSIEVHSAREWFERVVKERGKSESAISQKEGTEGGVNLVKIYSLLIQIDKKLDLILKELKERR
ncbi:MAG: hypothetical protein DRJ66_06510 [Thermoprotei archaeon]|nr:MAG: hypothetical protein DRJ66_06510 [Thermoprotei archaeon]